MEIRIHELLDGLEDSSVPMEETDVVSAMRIKELTRMKIEQTEPVSVPRYSSRKRVITFALAAALLLALGLAAVFAPGGTFSNFTSAYEACLKENGYVEHDWNVLTEDATPSRPNASQQINNVLGYLGTQPPRTVILLMHCNGDKTETVKALPEIIHFLRDWGYKFGVVTPMTPQPW